MLNQEVEALINEALFKAKTEGHEYVTVEHILYTLLKCSSIIYLCESLNIPWKKIQDQLLHFIKENTPRKTYNKKPEFTIAVHRVLQRALIQVQSSGKNIVFPEHLLLSILEEKQSHSALVLPAIRGGSV